MNVDRQFREKILLTIDFIEFLSIKGNIPVNDGGRISTSASHAIMNLKNLLEVDTIKWYWDKIPFTYDRFKSKIEKSMKSQSYDTLRTLYDYKYILLEKRFLCSEIIEQHKPSLNIEPQEKKQVKKNKN